MYNFSLQTFMASLFFPAQNKHALLLKQKLCEYSFCSIFSIFQTESVFVVGLRAIPHKSDLRFILAKRQKH